MTDLIIDGLKRIPGVIDATLYRRDEKSGISKYRITTVEPRSDGAVSDLVTLLCDVHPDVWAVTLRMVRNDRMYHELTIRFGSFQPGLELRF